MAVEDGSMNNRDLTFTLVLTSLVAVTSVVFVVFICICCYRRNDDDESDDDLPKVAEYKSLDRTETGAKRDDIKQLHKHPPLDPHQRSPHLTRKSINVLKSAVLSLRFERPADKRFVTENVQPDQYSQSSLNKSLGVKSREALVSSNSLPNPTRNSEGGSASSSPFHRTLSTEADGSPGGATCMDNVPFDVPDYPPPGGEKLGKIQFHLSYDFQEMTLTLRVIRAVELPAKDFSGTSDPYVKIMLLPDKKHKLTTNIKRKNLNPRWNEIFAFEGFPYSKLMSRTLYMQVLDYDRFSRDDPIGEICLPLSDVDLAQGQTMWKHLQPCKGHTGKLGELLLSLCYQPAVGRITVTIIKARELKAKDINGLSDPYVKIWLMHDGRKVEKKKTIIKEKTLNPVFNESFIFNVPYERIRQTSLNISVMDYDRMGRNELIGQLILGSKSGPMEIKHWNEMFAKSRQPVAQWHILKDFG